MSLPGYHRFPSVHADHVVFTCEDDVWSTSLDGGPARRLTAGLAECLRPRLSPDGKWVAFAARDEGNPEVWVLPAEGGEPRRLTYLGASICHVVGWHGDEVLFCTDSGQPFLKVTGLRAVSVSGGEPRRLPLGHAMTVSYGAGGRAVLGRNTLDLARWKRYRGGTAGTLWVDVNGSGAFAPLVPQTSAGPVKGNLASPFLLGDRVWFVGDHEGIGNLYSCDTDGTGLARHSDHDRFYARNPSTDGQTVVWHAGGDLFRLDVATDAVAQIPVEVRGPATQRRRKYVDAAKYLTEVALHPEGHALAVVSRGQSFVLPNWELAVTPLTDARVAPGAARTRLTRWLSGGTRVVAVSDAGGEDQLVVHDAATGRQVSRSDAPIGRVVTLVPSPSANAVVLTNHRHEVMFVDLDAGTWSVLDRSAHYPQPLDMGLAWSPTGTYVAYGFADSMSTSVLKVAEPSTGKTRVVTRPILRDFAPCFDPSGRYLYFLSARVFAPVYDNLDFDMNFPLGMRPYCIALRKDVADPFVPRPRSPAELREERAREIGVGANPAPRAPADIDFDGIEDRVVAFPVPEGRYVQIAATATRVFFTTVPPAPQFGSGPGDPAPATLHRYDLRSLKLTRLLGEVTEFSLAASADVLVVRSGEKLRILEAGWDEKKPVARPAPAFGRETGQVDVARIKVLVEPVAEWRQMFDEAWRLQRDQFWTPDLAGVDWSEVHARYVPLVGRVATRSELSDLLWEMQGELGTSHCYEMGGDHRPAPSVKQGSLGAEFTWDADAAVWRIAHIAQGDSWIEAGDSPLRALGANAAVGESLLAVNGQTLGASLSPGQALMNLGGAAVSLTLGAGGAERTVVVRALEAERETPLRYRAWVEANRRWVHDATGGTVGYVHVPNMMGLGMSEFFRGYLLEMNRGGLVVDVRYNGGGHTSQLVLEKLARKRLGYGASRWGEPTPYFWAAVLGPLVAVTNEWAGSDGDIFCHVWKMLGLGPLVGKRTWGGVVGIWPRHPLADGTVTSQPEFSHWFNDVGFDVENYGTAPDLEVEMPPQDQAAGRDPQLARAVAVALEEMRANPKTVPAFPQPTRLALPRLPPRGAK